MQVKSIKCEQTWITNRGTLLQQNEMKICKIFIAEQDVILYFYFMQRDGQGTKYMSL